MRRALIWATLAAFVLATGSALAEDKPGQKKPGKGKFDGKGKGKPGEGMFKRLDANNDGKVNKDEFQKIADLGPGGKLKDNPELIGRMFERLDTDADGSISADEFKKFGDGKGKPGAKKPGKKKPDGDK